jgi:hypothetical protein
MDVPRLNEARMLPFIREVRPRAGIVLDFVAELSGRRLGSPEATDIRIANLLSAGFALMPEFDPDRDFPVAPDFSAHWDSDHLLIAGSRGPLYDGECEVPPGWFECAVEDKGLIVMAGSRMGLFATEDLFLVLNAAALQGGLVGALVPLRKKVT